MYIREMTKNNVFKQRENVTIEIYLWTTWIGHNVKKYNKNVKDLCRRGKKMLKNFAVI